MLIKHNHAFKPNKIKRIIVILCTTTISLLAARLLIAQSDDCTPGCDNVPSPGDVNAVFLNICPFGCGELSYPYPTGGCSPAFEYDINHKCCQWNGDITPTYYPGQCESGGCLISTTGTPSSPQNENYITTGTCTAG